VFLDVDDLAEIGNLGMYIKQTRSMLFFLSKGYFGSRSALASSHYFVQAHS